MPGDQDESTSRACGTETPAPDRAPTHEQVADARAAVDAGGHHRVLELLDARGDEDDLVRRAEMRRLVARSLMRLGRLTDARAELEQAELELARPETHWPALSVRVGAAVVNLHLGASHDALTTAIDAMVQLAEAPEAELEQNAHHVASIRNDVGVLFLDLGVPEAAVDLLERSLLDAPAERPTVSARLSLARAHLMIATRRRGDRDPDWNLSASRCLAAVVGMNERDRSPRRLVEAAVLTASVHLLFRDVDAAGRVLVASITHCDRLDDPTTVAGHHALLARVLRESGADDVAFGWAGRAAGLVDDVFDPRGRELIHHEIAFSYRLAGDHSEAARHFEASARLARSNDRHVHALVQHLVAQAQLAVEHRRVLRDQERLVDQATLDPLTKIANRHALDLHLAELAERGDRSMVAVLFLDVDQFKNVNDHLGHGAGDAVLVRLAELVSQSLRAGDSFYRYGGDEFVVILPSVDSQSAHITAERIRASIEADASDAPDVTVSIGCSVGLSDDVTMVLAGADAAVYVAKRSGRNRVAVAAPRPGS